MHLCTNEVALYIRVACFNGIYKRRNLSLVVVTSTFLSNYDSYNFTLHILSNSHNNMKNVSLTILLTTYSENSVVPAIIVKTSAATIISPFVLNSIFLLYGILCLALLAQSFVMIKRISRLPWVLLFINASACRKQ